MKNFKITIRWMILLLFVLVSWFYPVHADNTVAQLTLHAYGNSLTGSSNGNVGHAFLSIKNTTNATLNFLDYPIPAKEMITVSIWPDKMSPIKCGGVYINWEMVVCKNTNTSSISIDITKQQLDTIAKNSPKESYYHDGLDDTFTNIHDDAWHNCTTYSTKMWNLVAPKQYKITDGFLGVDAPKWVSKKINKMSGHQEGPFVVTRNVDGTDIFYVTKNKELVPAGFKVPNLYTPKVSKNSVSISWSSCKKWLLNGQTNITGYEVKYYLSNGSQTKTKTFSSEGGTISGLAYGKKYNYQVRAIFEKAGYHIYGQYSKVGSFTISKGSNASLSLNKSKISMYITESTKIKTTVTGKSKKIAWKSSNTKVATVKNGTITAKKSGTATITASYNGIKKNCRVTVKGDWYNKVLKSTSSYRAKYLNGKTRTIYRSQFNRYRLFDINKDGIQELLLYNERQENALFTYYNGKVMPLIYGSFRGIYVKGKYLIIQEGSSMRSTYYIYVIKKGKLKKTCELFETTSSIAVVPGYSVNGKKCSRATFMKASNKYLENMKSLQW